MCDQITLLPGQEWCECGNVREIEDRRACVNCGHVGCSKCMTLSTATDADANSDYVCGPECNVEWLETLVAYYEANTDEIVDAVFQKIVREEVPS